MWPLGLGLTFGVVVAPEADLPAHLKVVVKQERVAATARGVEVPLQSEVVLYQEAASRVGLRLISKAALVIEVQLPPELWTAE